MNKELEETKAAGRVARSAGKPITENPYPNPMTVQLSHRNLGASPSPRFFESWEEGWNDEQGT